MELQELIKKIRKDNDLSQEELAYKLNVSRSLVAKWENGISMPKDDDINRIKEIFDVDIYGALEKLKYDISVDSVQRIKKRWFGTAIAIIFITIIIALLISCEQYFISENSEFRKWFYVFTSFPVYFISLMFVGLKCYGYENKVIKILFYISWFFTSAFYITMHVIFTFVWKYFIYAFILNSFSFVLSHLYLLIFEKKEMKYLIRKFIIRLMFIIPQIFILSVLMFSGIFGDFYHFLENARYQGFLNILLIILTFLGYVLLEYQFITNKNEEEKNVFQYIIYVIIVSVASWFMYLNSFPNYVYEYVGIALILISLIVLSIYMLKSTKVKPIYLFIISLILFLIGPLVIIWMGSGF